MLELVWLIPALPLAGFLVLLAAGRRIGEPGAGWLATAACGGSFVATLIVVLMGIPFIALTVYAGMTQISGEVMEAASIDGAGPWQRFRDVTWPSLRPLFVLLIALSTLWDLRVFTQIYVLQQAGGITRETNLIGVWAYRRSSSGEFGGGAAVAFVMVGLTLLLTLFYLRNMFRQDELS